jgi:probable HAF family extracellular repeat protein
MAAQFLGPFSERQAMKSSVVVLFVMNFILFSAIAQAMTQYSAIDLGNLGGGQATVPFAVNNNGEVVGYSSSPSSNYARAFLYSNRQTNEDEESAPMQDLGTLGAESVAYDINDQGQIIGISGLLNGVWRGFVYSGSGPMTPLGSVADGINNLGQIVGTSSGPTSSSGFLRNPGGTVISTGSFLGTCINDNGIAAGVGFGTGYACVRGIDGQVQNLGFIGQPEAINNNGQIAGRLYGNSRHAFVTSSNGSLTDLGTLGGSESYADGMNNNGDVVGAAYRSSNEASRAFLCLNGGSMQDLNTMVNLPAGWVLTCAMDINDNGQIVASGSLNGGWDHAFLLTPVPEPSTFALLGMGGIGLIAFVWRRRR